jgi:predicted chitinase
MPGIHSADIKTLTRGSLKKATVKLTANNKQQFDIIDLLYMRLGYTVLLEWGNSIYTTNGFDKEILRNTLIEEKFFESAGSDSYFTFLEDIENKRDKYAGNYDALLGKVSNFNWSFNTDGSYDIELTIISLGDVIESLKSNLSVDKKTNDFLNTFKTSTPEVVATDPPDPTVDEEDSSADIITAMLAIYKFVNRTLKTGTNVQIIQSDGVQHDVGLLLDNDDSGDGQYIASSSTDYVLSKTFKIKVYSNANGFRTTTYNGTGRYKVTQTFSSNNDEIGKKEAVDAKNEFQKATKELTIDQLIKGGSVGKLVITELEKLTVIQHINRSAQSEPSQNIDVTNKTDLYSDEDLTTIKPSPLKVERKSDTKTIPNPLVKFGWNDAFKLLTKDSPIYYIRFGALLEYIKDNIIIKIDNTKKDPLFDIDISEWDTYMYSLPNQISLDPRVCIVRNNNIEVGIPGKKTQAFTKLQYFKEIDNPNSINKSENSAYPLNIYLNFDFVLECLKVDNKGNVSVYELISNICTGLNRALGGINNLEPIIDETDNTLRIIDTTPIPGHSAEANFSKYKLQIYGYDKIDNDYISNFVRKVDLKTAITPEYATMITVGATAGGYVKGVEATAFSKWNTGLTDRFKEELLPPDGIKNNTDKNEAATNYVDIFYYPKGRANRFGINDFGSGMKLSDNIIEKNLSIVTEYYKWLIAYSTPGDQPSGGTVGFIPFKLGLTLDGISGIKIYNVLRVNTEFLPKAYGKTVDLIVTGVSHRLNNNDWETSVEATVMPKTGAASTVAITAEDAVTSLQSVEDSPLGLNPPSTGWEILHPKYPNNTQQGKNIDIIINTFKKNGVTNPYAIVGALSVIGKESSWKPQSEKLYYSKERLPEVWGVFSKTGKRVADGEGKLNYNSLAKEYAGNPEKLSNFVYGWNGSNPKGMRSKDRAVGNLKWGDGYKYRGRGFNQITWKANYETYSEEFGVDLVKDPDKLNEPELAAKVAFSFFFRVFKAGRKYGIKSNPIDFMNSFTSIDEAIVYFAKANSGSIKNTATKAITNSREKRKYFNIVKN